MGLSRVFRNSGIGMWLYSFPNVIITDYHKLGGLQQKFIFCSSGGQKCKIRGLPAFAPSWGSGGTSVSCLSPAFWRWLALLDLPWLVVASLPCLLCSHMACPLLLVCLHAVLDGQQALDYSALKASMIWS